jgi:molybdopterin/thiamine biosynthesis adenylyltransferase
MKTDSPDALRYAAHLALPELGTDGHRRIRQSSVALIGLGGLGCAAAQYLCSSGVGQLSLCDFDRVETSNLARQVLYTTADIGRRKTEVAAEVLQRLNPHCQVTVMHERVDEHLATELLQRHDMAVDASDNYGTRLAVNRASLALGKPWIMGSCMRMEGQFMLFRGRAGNPCYRCVYGAAPDTLEDCPGAGIFAPVAGIIGASMAHAALRHLAGLAVSAKLHLLDAGDWNWQALTARPRPGCPECAHRFD